MNRAPWLAWLALALLGAASAQTPGTIAAVHVYRGQALVTRVVEFTAQAGTQEVVVPGLPAMLLPDSLYASAAEPLVVRGVRFREQPVAEAQRDDVRALDEQIGAKQDDLARLQSQRGVLQKQSQYLDKLENFVAPTANVELTKGVLNSDTLVKLAEYAMTQRQQLAEKQLELDKQQKKAEADLQVLIRQRATLTGGTDRSRREAVVFVEAKQAGPARFDLNYLVGGVGWSPAYVARADSRHNKLTLEYLALVTQVSGEDWPDVELTLSTGTPRMMAAAPRLAPLYVAVGENAGEANADARQYNEQRRELQRQMKEGGANAPADHAMRGPAGPQAGGGMPGAAPATQATALPVGTKTDDVAANVLAARLQNLELTASDEVVRSARMHGPDDEGLAVDYPLSGRIALPSRRDQQLFRIAALDLAPTFFYTAVPLLSGYVYQAAESRNTSQLALLPGPYSAYRDGAFAGQGTLPTIASGQAVTIGLGTESRLRISRELEEKKTEIHGGNQQLRYTYRFRIQNYTDRPAVIRLWDRLPQAPNDQITVSLLDGGQKLSADPLYVAQEKPRGLLRWDIEVPANANGAQATTLSYQFQIEFDKNLELGGLPAQMEERMKQDLATLEEMRH